MQRVLNTCQRRGLRWRWGTRGGLGRDLCLSPAHCGWGWGVPNSFRQGRRVFPEIALLEVEVTATRLCICNPPSWAKRFVPLLGLLFVLELQDG